MIINDYNLKIHSLRQRTSASALPAQRDYARIMRYFLTTGCMQIISTMRVGIDQQPDVLDVDQQHDVLDIDQYHDLLDICRLVALCFQIQMNSAMYQIQISITVYQIYISSTVYQIILAARCIRYILVARSIRYRLVARCRYSYQIQVSSEINITVPCSSMRLSFICI